MSGTLTATERALFAALQPGQRIATKTLIDTVWDYCRRPADPHRTIRVHICNLRRKLQDDGIEIIGVFGQGYQLTPPPPGACVTVKSVECAETSRLTNSPSVSDRPDGVLFSARMSMPLMSSPSP